MKSSCRLKLFLDTSIVNQNEKRIFENVIQIEFSKLMQFFCPCYFCLIDFFSINLENCIKRFFERQFITIDSFWHFLFQFSIQKNLYTQDKFILMNLIFLVFDVFGRIKTNRRLGNRYLESEAKFASWNQLHKVKKQSSID